MGGNTAITDNSNYWQKEEHKIIFVEQMMTETEAKLSSLHVCGLEHLTCHMQESAYGRNPLLFLTAFH